MSAGQPLPSSCQRLAEQLDFFGSLPDTDDNGLANMTLNNTLKPGMQEILRLTFRDLLPNATGIFWTVTALLFTLLAFIITL